MSAADLLEYVNAGDSDETYAATCFAQATALVEGHVGDADVPAEILSRAVLEVGAELFHRRKTKNGIAQFADIDAAPIRIARDPMVAARPLLAPYLPMAFA